ncbi:hypothetical protein [Actinoplanes auranticolor]|uniref:Isocitrate/isopropylmalate dehydrogenase n=1 Tax=Actinoplanes auranticolor TaxID=47988 RepID=A0A919S8J6_9ACTN|nr:hypothetical protein [Actinoplanes auranticolor]GIM67754.1 hypothetical protein Aau02nite_28730 [Actinoplanes auranticolor]
MKRIAVIPGDGLGKEVTAVARTAQHAATRRLKHLSEPPTTFVERMPSMNRR